ncbi:MAG: hypothetical protein QGH60_19045 [Phycisphaerae bacterium]|jgi:hypothetical protein|nr:hypothetical protein [Phycisphaerae bacterium]
MARQPGTKASDNTKGSGFSGVIGRAVGFSILAGLAMAIVATLVLMPAWANAVRAEHDLAVKRAEIEYSRRVVAAGARLNNAIHHDRVVNERLVKGTVRQNLIHTQPVEYPPAPGGWRMELADKLAQPKTRRGLFVVAFVALAGGMFLFVPPLVKLTSRSRQAT